MIVSGTLNGTGASIYVGCGFIPDEVYVYNCEASTPIMGIWNRDMRTAEQIGGVTIAAALARSTVGAGIAPYRGGTVTASGNTAYVIPFADAYSGKTNNLVAANTSSSTITTWTLGNSGNKTGNFNFGVNTTYVGEGSKVVIWDDLTKTEYVVVMTALTNDGDAANEVTLSEAVPSGTVRFIGPMYDYIAAPADVVMPQGFSIDDTDLSVSGEYLSFTAIKFN